MALNLEQKKAVVSELAEAAANAHSLIAAEYRGMTVGALTELRAKARQDNVALKVAKNTLVKRAVADTDFECVTDELTGPLLYAFSMEDPGAAARLIKDAAKTDDALVTKLVAIGGKLYPASELGRLADMPTYEQALAQLMGVMKAPVEKLVRTLAEPTAKMVRTVAAVRDQKQAA